MERFTEIPYFNLNIFPNDSPFTVKKTNMSCSHVCLNVCLNDMEDAVEPLCILRINTKLTEVFNLHLSNSSLAKSQSHTVAMPGKLSLSLCLNVYISTTLLNGSGTWEATRQRGLKYAFEQRSNMNEEDIQIKAKANCSYCQSNVWKNMWPVSATSNMRKIRMCMMKNRHTHSETRQLSKRNWTV